MRDEERRRARYRLRVVPEMHYTACGMSATCRECSTYRAFATGEISENCNQRTISGDGHSR